MCVALEKTNSDIVFSPGTLPIEYLKSDRPIVFRTDATFAGMVDFYPEFTNLCTESIKASSRIAAEWNRRLYQDVALLSIVPNGLRERQLNFTRMDPEKVKVVPFGANIDCNHSLNISKNSSSFVFVTLISAVSCFVVLIGTEKVAILH